MIWSKNQSWLLLFCANPPVTRLGSPPPFLVLSSEHILESFLPGARYLYFPMDYRRSFYLCPSPLPSLKKTYLVLTSCPKTGCFPRWLHLKIPIPFMENSSLSTCGGWLLVLHEYNPSEHMILVYHYICLYLS